MYNLRFYLNDDDNIIKSDYKHIPRKDDLDLIFYNDLILSDEALSKAFLFFAKHDLNHKCTIKKNFILHEFEISDRIMQSLIENMHEYKKDIDNSTKQLQKQLAPKFQENKKRERKNEVAEQQRARTNVMSAKMKHKYRLRRENKYRRRRVIALILVLATLSTAIYGGVKATKNIYVEAKDNIENRLELTDEQMELLKGTVDRTTAIQEQIANIGVGNEEISDISDMVDSITQSLATNNYDYSLDIDADDWTGTQKYVDCYNNYYPLIEKYAHMYGIDPKVALAIACHERGIHSNEIDSGGGLGLFQVQIGIWDGYPVRAFNFETNEWEEYTIHLDNVRNVEENIKAGIMIFQECLRRDDYNIAMSVQEYNFGHGGLMTAMDAASNDLGIPLKSLEEKGNTDWFNYRTYNRSSSGYQMGDPDYVENVFKYIHNGDLLSFRTPDGENITIKYHNLSEEMSRG